MEAAKLKLERARAALAALDSDASEASTSDSDDGGGGGSDEQNIGVGSKTRRLFNRKSATAAAAEAERDKARNLSEHMAVRRISLSQQIRRGVRGSSSWRSGLTNFGGDGGGGDGSVEDGMGGMMGGGTVAHQHGNEVFAQAEAVLADVQNAAFTQKQLEKRVDTVEAHATASFGAVREQLESVLGQLKAFSADEYVYDSGSVGGEGPGVGEQEEEEGGGELVPNPPSDASTIMASPRRRRGAQMLPGDGSPRNGEAESQEAVMDMLLLESEPPESEAELEGSLPGQVASERGGGWKEDGQNEERQPEQAIVNKLTVHTPLQSSGPVVPTPPPVHTAPAFQRRRR